MTSTRLTERLRRLGFVGGAAITGILLLITGLAVTVLESQMRIDAATAAVYVTPAKLEQLRQAGLDDVGQEDYRNYLIAAGMTSGGQIPRLVLEITEEDDGAVYWSWVQDDVFIARSEGGWQPKPVAALTVAGLALVLGSLFVAASRWRPRPSDAALRHPATLTRPSGIPG